MLSDDARHRLFATGRGALSVARWSGAWLAYFHRHVIVRNRFALFLAGCFCLFSAIALLIAEYAVIPAYTWLTTPRPKAPVVAEALPPVYAPPPPARTRKTKKTAPPVQTAVQEPQSQSQPVYTPPVSQPAVVQYQPPPPPKRLDYRECEEWIAYHQLYPNGDRVPPECSPQYVAYQERRAREEEQKRQMEAREAERRRQQALWEQQQAEARRQQRANDTTRAVTGIINAIRRRN
jgi:hypothetical protein